MKLTPLQARRLENFKKNRRAYWSLWIFLTLFVISLFAELIANDRPLVVSYRGELAFPVFKFYPETAFGGEFKTEAEYTDPAVQCLIRTGGVDLCFDEPEAIMDALKTGGAHEAFEQESFQKGWEVWPLIPFSYNTIDYAVSSAPSKPDARHWFGTDDQTRDILARIIYGFRLSIFFTLIVTICSSIIGIIAGAAQGYFGGVLDLFLQRVIEIWASTPSLYVIIIVAAIFTMNFWLLAFLLTAFSWINLVGVVRAEFLRARNFEYVRAARALGVSDWTIMFRHVLPNAMVATVTMLPFITTGTISTLAVLDFLGFGLPVSYPSLGEMALQAKARLNAYWIGFAAFFTFTIMLSLLVFIFEGVRDAFDPRKTFK